MKRCYVGLFLVLIGIFCQAQVTEKLKQISKLQVYIKQLEKGYSIVPKGLTTIGRIKGFHFSLDQDFFGGLEAVNPNIKAYVEAADITTIRYEIIRLSNTCLSGIRGSSGFSAAEQEYIQNVFNNLLSQCEDLQKHTDKVLSSSVLKMSDDERLRLVGQYFTEMEDRYSFCRSFTSQLHVQVLLRVRERNGIGVLKILNGN